MTKGVILAGGKNSRMGTDKGLLMVDGISIAERIRMAMAPIVDEVIVISNSDRYDNFGCPVFPDIYKERGPLGGIHSALVNTKAKRILVASCDMPYLETNALKYLRDASDDAKAVVPVHSGGKREPLCAIYSATLLPLIEERLRRGEVKMHALLDAIEVREVNFLPEEEPERIFRNINTPGEYQSLKPLAYVA